LKPKSLGGEKKVPLRKREGMDGRLRMGWIKGGEKGNATSAWRRKQKGERNRAWRRGRGKICEGEESLVAGERKSRKIANDFGREKQDFHTKRAPRKSLRERKESDRNRKKTKGLSEKEKRGNSQRRARSHHGRERKNLELKRRARGVPDGESSSKGSERQKKEEGGGVTR